MKSTESPYCRCLYYSSNALARVMTKLAEEAFAPTGLPPSHAFLVMSINKTPGIHAGELAELMMLTPSTITRLLEKLEEMGLVKRMAEGRNMLVFPTPASVELNELISKQWYALYQKIVAELGEEPSGKLTADIFAAAVKLGRK